MSIAVILSFFLYVLTFSTSAIALSLGIRSKKKWLIGVSILTPALLVGLRYGIGADFANYTALYSKYANEPIELSLFGLSGEVEATYILLSKIVYHTIDTPMIVFLSYSLLTTLFFVLALLRLNLKHTGLIYFLILSILFIQSFELMRYMLAIAVIMYASSHLISSSNKRGLLKFIAWGIVAIFVHRMTIIYIVALPVAAIATRKLKIKLGISYTVIWLLLSLVLVSALSPLPITEWANSDIFGKFTLYSNHGEPASGKILLLKLAILGYILTFYNSIKHKKYFILLLGASIAEIGVMLMLSESIPISRLAAYLTPFSLILLTYTLPDLPRNINKKTTGLWLRYIIVTGYGVGMVAVSTLIVENHIVPYNSWLGF